MQKNISNVLNKTTNELWQLYENAKKNCAGVVATWRQEFIDDSQFNSFKRTYAYANIDEIPYGLVKKFRHLEILLMKTREVIDEIKTEPNYELEIFHDTGY